MKVKNTATNHDAQNLEHFRSLLQEHMAKKGLRSTDQRRLIVETFFSSPSHVSIEELLAQVRKQDARVGYATVYRTLKLLTECGVAFERKFGDGLTRYDGQRCVVFRNLPGDASSLPDNRITGLATDARKRLWTSKYKGLCMYTTATRLF